MNIYTIALIDCYPHEISVLFLYFHVNTLFKMSFSLYMVIFFAYIDNFSFLSICELVNCEKRSSFLLGTYRCLKFRFV